MFAALDVKTGTVIGELHRRHRSVEKFLWPDGSMRSVAAAMDSRSAEGLEAMIAALWSVYESSTIAVDSTPSRVAITWDVVRTWTDLRADGPNVFQARLHPSGVVELAYHQAPSAASWR